MFPMPSTTVATAALGGALRLRQILKTPLMNIISLKTPKIFLYCPTNNSVACLTCFHRIISSIPNSLTELTKLLHTMLFMKKYKNNLPIQHY